MSIDSKSKALHKVLVLFGPTASGKTDILFRLFSEKTAAGMPGAEIVSADSMQVYRGMDIGTAKPSSELRMKLPHHLIDIRDPNEQFTAGDFVGLAERACREIAGLSLLPVISGGTAFYMKSFLNGLPESPPSDNDIREELRGELRESGADFLMDELMRVDPESAKRIHPNDTYRLTRALEVARLSGRPLSSFLVPSLPRVDFDILCLGLERERSSLYARIEERVDAMFREGLIEEIDALVGKGYGPGDPGLRAIGYREFFPGGSLPRVSTEREVDEARSAIKTDSRRYAKRQMCFFRSMPHVEWFDAEDIRAVRARILSWIRAE